MAEVSLLKDIPLFSCLSPQELEALSEISILRVYPRNKIIISEGETTTSLYVLFSGKAHAISIDDNGRQIVLNRFYSGDYFGEMSFIDGEPRCATVETRTQSRLLIVPREKFRGIIASNPDICFSLMRGLIEKIRKTTQQVQDLVFKDVYGRVARLLFEMSTPEEDGRTVREKMTHQEIADMVGSSREMVSRILKELLVGGYISVNKKQISVLKNLPYAW